MPIRNWESGNIVLIWGLTVVFFLVFMIMVDDVLYPTRIFLLGMWLLSTLIASAITWIWFRGRDNRDKLR